MSGNEAARYTRRDAALLLVGALATTGALFLIWLWTVPAAETGFRALPLISAEAEGPLRLLPDDPGGAEAPTTEREFQLAITATDPRSVWSQSRAVEPSQDYPAAVPGAVSSQRVATPHSEPGGAPPDGGAEDRGDAEFIRPMSEEPLQRHVPVYPSAQSNSLEAGSESNLIQPLPGELPMEEADSPDPGPAAISPVIRQPPASRPGW